MYSQLQNVQILIALLKEFEIKHVVMSPGGASIPIITSMEHDGFFKCYSVIDERSAAFFALGLAQSLKEPVMMVCTSGTAVCNYLSGVTEAFYQKVPLVVITADRHPYLYLQMETQTINQKNVFTDVCKKTVNLPVVQNDDDFWYCKRLVNEALLELDHHGAGPVHINIPTGAMALTMDCTAKELPKLKTMERVSQLDKESVWMEKLNELKSFKRILVIFGQNPPYSKSDIENIERFSEKYNCALSIEHISNLQSDKAMITYPVTETFSNEDLDGLLPDLIISLGDNISAAKIKPYFRQFSGKFEHWCIEETGRVKDVFKNLTKIFECSISEFFDFFANKAPTENTNDGVYYSLWKKAVDQVVIPELPFTNVFVAQSLAKNIPENSILHTAILNSTRHMQFFKLNKNVEVFSNIGALGIDGSMSTFMGQAAAAKDKLCFLLIGDLSFFYDMNSAGIRHIGNNVRLVMVNNTGGGEFHITVEKSDFPRLNDHITAQHEATAKGWIESLGYTYLSASTEEELDRAMTELTSTSEVPIFLEVFTDMELDAKITKDFYASNRHEGAKTKGKRLIQGVAKSVIGNKGADKAKKIIKTITE